MISFFITFIILLIFLVWAVFIFSSIILDIVINIILLWLVAIRGYADIKKKKREKFYLISLLITLLLFIFGNNWFFEFSAKTHIWWPTLFLVVAYLLAQIVFYVDKSFVKDRKDLKKSKK